MNWKVKLLFILGGLGILDTIAIFMIERIVDVGILLPAVIGAIFICLGLLELNVISYPNILDNLLVKRLLLSGLITFLISFIIIETLIFSAIARDNVENSDYLIILGGGIVGTEATSTLKARLEAALKYINNNSDLEKVIVTGGQGPLAKVSEAQVMKDYLIHHGVADSKIISEDSASSTMENLKFSKQILDKLTSQANLKVIIVTSEFHLWRAKFLAARNGIKAKGIAAQTPYYILPNALLREYLAVIKSYVWDRQSMF